jgi:hypothetical protein
MLTELLFIVDLLQRRGLHQTPQQTVSPPSTVKSVFGRGKSRTPAVSPPPKPVAPHTGPLNLLHPRAPQTVTRPAERYFRRPKGLN